MLYYRVWQYTVANSVKHPKKLHVWWGISKKYKIKPYFFTENLEQVLYRKILSARLPISDPTGWIFQQDNDPKHRAQKTRDWLDTNTPEWMSDWVAQSPDANPIENMWSILSLKVYTKTPSKLAGLKRRIEMCCDEFDDEIIENAIIRCPNE